MKKIEPTLNLKNNIKIIRELLGFNQTKFGQIFNETQDVISNYESRPPKKLNEAFVAKIANFAGVTYDELLYKRLSIESLNEDELKDKAEKLINKYSKQERLLEEPQQTENPGQKDQDLDILGLYQQQIGVQDLMLKELRNINVSLTKLMLVASGNLELTEDEASDLMKQLKGTDWPRPAQDVDSQKQKNTFSKKRS